MARVRSRRLIETDTEAELTTALGNKYGAEALYYSLEAGGKWWKYDEVEQVYIEFNKDEIILIAAQLIEKLDTLISGTKDGTKYLRDDWTWDNPPGGGGGGSLDDLTDVTITTPSDGDVLTYDNVTGEWVNAVPTGGGGGQTLGAYFEGLGSTVVLVNSIVYTRAKTAMTISGWSIVAEGSSPTCTIDIFKIATGTTLPSASICASALPALATGNALKSTTLTGWTTSVSADDMLAFKVTACANATKIQIVLYP
jgi:hypothetical protein